MESLSGALYDFISASGVELSAEQFVKWVREHRPEVLVEAGEAETLALADRYFNAKSGDDKDDTLEMTLISR